MCCAAICLAVHSLLSVCLARAVTDAPAVSGAGFHRAKRPEPEGCVTFTQGFISLVTGKVFLPFVQDRNADAYFLCHLTRSSASAADFTNCLRSFFRTKALACA